MLEAARVRRRARLALELVHRMMLMEEQSGSSPVPLKRTAWQPEGALAAWPGPAARVVGCRPLRARAARHLEET